LKRSNGHCGSSVTSIFEDFAVFEKAGLTHPDLDKAKAELANPRRDTDPTPHMSAIARRDALYDMLGMPVLTSSGPVIREKELNPNRGSAKCNHKQSIADHESAQIPSSVHDRSDCNIVIVD
jgi:hypothetical protein